MAAALVQLLLTRSLSSITQHALGRLRSRQHTIMQRNAGWPLAANRRMHCLQAHA
jgi:hypothetical protein